MPPSKYIPKNDGENLTLPFCELHSLQHKAIKYRPYSRFTFLQGGTPMKKLAVSVSCLAVILILSKVSFAQSSEIHVHADAPVVLSVDDIVGTARTPVHAHAAQHAVPFGYPPYPTVGGNPAYGVPYSYPRSQRRLGARLNPPAMQPYPLPHAPGALDTVPAQPTVFYRPTPIRNFMTMLTAPRPYIGYDPYVGYPPYPGYIPPQ